MLCKKGPLSIGNLLASRKSGNGILAKFYTNYGEFYELHEFLLGINLSFVIFLYKAKSCSKEIRVIRTIS
jgi:hypothetical protein